MIEGISTLLDSVVTDKFDKPVKSQHDPLTDQTVTAAEMVDQVKKLLLSNFVDGPPFTMQRLAELLVDPNKFYVRTAIYKYLSALKTVLSVASISSDYPVVDIEAEIAKSKTDSSSVNYGEPGVVMTKISWIVDTGLSDEIAVEDEVEAENEEEGSEKKDKTIISKSKNSTVANISADTPVITGDRPKELPQHESNVPEKTSESKKYLMTDEDTF